MLHMCLEKGLITNKTVLSAYSLFANFAEWFFANFFATICPVDLHAFNMFMDFNFSLTPLPSFGKSGRVTLGGADCPFALC